MKRIRTLVIVAAAALVLTACSAGGADLSVQNSSGAVSERLPSALPGFAADQSEAGAGDAAMVGDRQVITTGQVSITVDDPIVQATEATRIVERAGGHVDERTEEPATDVQKASAHLVLRIPSAKLSATLDELKKLGDVNYTSISGSDVTTQTRDLDARIKALQTSVDRLLALMTDATDTTDLIAIETALSERQANLDSLQSQRDYLSDQVSLSTVGLDLVSEGTVAEGAPQDFWAGIVSGWNALIVALGGAVIAIGVVLPWLAFLAIIGVVVWLITRKVKQRRRKRATDDIE